MNRQEFERQLNLAIALRDGEGLMILMAQKIKEDIDDVRQSERQDDVLASK